MQMNNLTSGIKITKRNATVTKNREFPESRQTTKRCNDLHASRHRKGGKGANDHLVSERRGIDIV